MIDFGISAANAAFAKGDAAVFATAMIEGGWPVAAQRGCAGTPGISVHHGKDVVLDRHPSCAPHVVVVTTPAVFMDSLGGDSIRDGEAGVRVTQQPQRVVFEVEFSAAEAAELGL